MTLIIICGKQNIIYIMGHSGMHGCYNRVIKYEHIRGNASSNLVDT